MAHESGDPGEGLFISVALAAGRVALRLVVQGIQLARLLRATLLGAYGGAVARATLIAWGRRQNVPEAKGQFRHTNRAHPPTPHRERRVPSHLARKVVVAVAIASECPLSSPFSETNIAFSC